MLCPKIQRIIEKNKEDASKCIPIWSQGRVSNYFYAWGIVRNVYGIFYLLLWEVGPQWCTMPLCYNNHNLRKEMRRAKGLCS